MNLSEGKMRRTFGERGNDRLATAFDFPNDNRRQAVSWNDGPLLVPAGPGSGKTRIVDTTARHGGPHRRPRALVTVVLDNPATDREPDEIVLSYPPISRAAIQATLCYAWDLAEELDE